MARSQKTGGLIQKAEQLTAVRSIRGGLVSLIPVLIIGAFALILKSFPVRAYQEFIETALNGVLLELFNLVYTATFGVLSVYMTVSISRAYMSIKSDHLTVAMGAWVSSIASFFMMAGVGTESFALDRVGPKSMFLAILTGLGASALYLKFNAIFRNRRGRRLLTTGADREFNRVLYTLVPTALTVIVFAVFNMLIVRLFDVESFRDLLDRGFASLFEHIKLDFFKGFFFVLLSSVLWFFGIHGSDALEQVMQMQFYPGLAENQAAVAAGGAPANILTKEFFDCFVLMGGCGSTICLLIAILLFSKNKARRGLGFTAAFPMLFNINELMVFGLPIIFNPVMLIPFLLVPLVCYSSAYLALTLGIVPMITSGVEWTTPIILGGYSATGSFAGSALQIFNVALGVAIYFPFVKLLDRRSDAHIKDEYDSFVRFFMDNEQTIGGTRLIDLDDAHGVFAKGLCAEIKYGLADNLRLAYQPQYNYDGECIGAEALLRWDHPVHGMLYPPLVVKLAEEGGVLTELEKAVLSRVLKDRPLVLERFGKDIKISFNVTGTTVNGDEFLQYCRKLNDSSNFRGKNLCLEVTEQAALAFDDSTIAKLNAFRDMGLLLAIDDFSMGQTSLHYLKDSIFDVIKLDGSLIKELFAHKNSREIVSSITGLARSLNMIVLAEYVETEEQKNALHEIGCDCYQGYLYSPAVFVDEKK